MLPTAQPSLTPKPTTRCHEGDACWNCKTDGNKRCGPGDKRNLPTLVVPYPLTTVTQWSSWYATHHEAPTQ